jgi:hypothetical protein
MLTPREMELLPSDEDVEFYRAHGYWQVILPRHTNDRLCRQVDGVPDFTDPEICPTLWPLG